MKKKYIIPSCKTYVFHTYNLLAGSGPSDGGDGEKDAHGESKSHIWDDSDY